MAHPRGSTADEPSPTGGSVDWSALVRQDRVHRSLYTDPAVFSRELDRVFGLTWVYLAHESQLQEPNSFLTARLGHRPVIITRDRDGGIHGLLNRCAHRAATVCR